MSDTLKKAVTEALISIIPEGSEQNIVESGALGAVIVDGDQVGIILDFKNNAPDNVQALRALVESTAKTVEGVSAANVVVSANKPQKEAPKMGVGGKSAPTPTNLPGVKHVIAVASGKGGVGKSTTSINLALALKAKGLKVGLMDADIFGPSVPTLVGSDEKPGIKGKVIQPLEAYGIKVMSVGFLIDVDQPVVWRGPRVMGATQQLLKDVAWEPLDVLVVDMPPGTGDVQLTMVQQAVISGAVIVSTPQDLALIDARKGITMFEKTDVPILGIIENMSSFICPSCGSESYIFGHGGAKETAKTIGCDFLGGIPLHMSVRESADSGKPIVACEPDNPISKAYLEIAETLKGKLSI
ncbi:Mrp/NBP35 family ATP-binding protein [Kordiimonas sp. SCSIO 12603]|uniref:Mrp/NBP35 family ATP-binding protein n=1 Tax=Kordiimonas sp. SCSIO 12603 TaxID=2829596 RepID=UPI002106A86F|nr:Mrp/NBP35 family ATP-binding protein [Kordiimonas sp. SCSIO 12603]UTW57884.1 Mrp/NBP35 family ATP-binding protein [Kordiimonas sp. SCSIO 12603]